MLQKKLICCCFFLDLKFSNSIYLLRLLFFSSLLCLLLLLVCHSITALFCVCFTGIQLCLSFSTISFTCPPSPHLPTRSVAAFVTYHKIRSDFPRTWGKSFFFLSTQKPIPEEVMREALPRHTAQLRKKKLARKQLELFLPALWA